MRRLDQWLANLGYCSRREAAEWVASGRITIQGKQVTDPSKRASAADIAVDGEPLDHPEGLLLLMHKPLNTVCSYDSHDGPRVYDLLPGRWTRRNPAVSTVGRLDRDTTGLLLLTDVPGLVHQLTSPKRKVPKVYRFKLRDSAPIPQQQHITALFSTGTYRLEGETAPCLPATLQWTGPSEGTVILVEGKYHQVRRMFAEQDCHVVDLHRESFGTLNLGALPEGQWRELPRDYKFC